jgi:hypothetical protein
MPLVDKDLKVVRQVARVGLDFVSIYSTAEAQQVPLL